MRAAFRIGGNMQGITRACADILENGARNESPKKRWRCFERFMEFTRKRRMQNVACHDS